MMTNTPGKTNGLAAILAFNWTAREAFACALCWSEFQAPETRADTPETYWLSITERARNSIRQAANEKMLLAIARRDAVAVPHCNAVTGKVFTTLKDELGLKVDYRVRQVLSAVWTTFAHAQPKTSPTAVSTPARLPPSSPPIAHR